MARWRTHWVAGFISLTLLIGIAGQYNLWRQVGRPFPGYMSYTNLHGGYWTVAENTPPWWPGIKNAGLQYSDRIMKLDDLPFGSDQAVIFSKAYRANVPVMLTVSRQGVEITLEAAALLFSLTHFLEIKTTHIIIGLGFWLLAVTIYYTRPDEPLNQIFALAGCLLALNQWLWIRFLFHLEPHPLSNVLDLVVLLFYAFFPPVLAHAFLLFPPSARWTRPRTYTLLYSLTPFFITIFVTRRILLWQGQTVPFWFSQLEQYTFHTAQLMSLIVVLLFILRLCFLAYHHYQARLPMFQYYVLLIGFALPTLYIARTVWNSIGGTNFSSWQYQIDWRYLVLAAPLAVAFVVIRYQTFHGSNKIILVVFALGITAFSASVGNAILQYGYPQLVGATDTVPLFIPLFILMFLFSIGWLYLSTPDGIAGWLLYREARQYGDVKLFGQNLIRQTQWQDLPQAIIQSLHKLNIEQAAIWFKDEETEICRLTAQSGHWNLPLPPCFLIPPLIREQPGQILRVNTPHHSLPPWLSNFQEHSSIRLVGLLGQGELIGVLVLGSRWHEEIYTERDLEIMELVVQQISLFLLTALQVNQLRQVPNRILYAQEQERLKMAQELHDTIQQFLGRLPFRLAVSRKHITTRPDKSDLILKECMDDISEAAITLRHIRGNLSPSLIEADLSHSLRILVDRFQRHAGTRVTLDIPSHLDGLLEVSSRHALYRVIQQALDNVEAHAKAMTAQITLQHSGNRVTFSIADDGVGFSATTRERAEASGSFGLQSMETRIKSQGGDITIYSIPEQGTVVSGWVPV